jgi:hypothetical protein
MGQRKRYGLLLNCDLRHIEKLLNLGNEVYHTVAKMYGGTLGGYEAE